MWNLPVDYGKIQEISQATKGKNDKIQKLVAEKHQKIQSWVVAD